MPRSDYSARVREKDARAGAFVRLLTAGELVKQQSFLGISALSFPRPGGASENTTWPFWQALVQHLHRVRYIERGEPDAPRTVICVHGILLKSSLYFLYCPVSRATIARTAESCLPVLI